MRPLDPRLGKVPNLNAAAILDDGSPVLIVDVEDLLRSMDQYIQTGALSRCETRPVGPSRKKRILVVDDSITVREVERQLLLHKGYEVVIAVDGMDGWNKVRAEQFDLLVSDIDMPRMSGLQLVSAVRGDERLRDLPVVIVSYKEREEDRHAGWKWGRTATSPRAVSTTTVSSKRLKTSSVSRKVSALENSRAPHGVSLFSACLLPSPRSRRSCDSHSH